MVSRPGHSRRLLSLPLKKPKTAFLKSPLNFIRELAGQIFSLLSPRPGRWAAFVVAALAAFAATASKADVEGTVNAVRPIPDGGLELKLSSGTNPITVNVSDAGEHSP